MNFDQWWAKYHANYYDKRTDDVPPWTVKSVARHAWNDATHQEFLRRMDREMERAKEAEDGI